MRSIVIALTALAFATGASATTPAGPYTLQAKGKCEAANGQSVTASLCAPKAAKVCNPATSKPCGNTCLALGLACNGSYGVKKPPGLKKAR
jgi:hypothetical protein